MKQHCLLVVLACVCAIQGCAVKQYAISSLGNALSKGGDLYSSDDDIELVGQALPFSLKTIEALLAEVPDHRRLLVTAASGFTRYSYAYVDLQAFELEESDVQRSRVLKARAKRLYLRGRDYAVRAVELRKADFITHLRHSPEAALKGFTAEQVPELYWLAVSWAAAIASDKTDMELLADLNLIEPLIRKCLALDESFDQGALHEFMIAYQGGRSELQGGSNNDARGHFRMAMQLSGHAKISPLVSLAESVSVSTQNRREFEDLLQRALAFDVDAHPSNRLANLVAQKQASLLLSRADSLFLED